MASAAAQRGQIRDAAAAELRYAAEAGDAEAVQRLLAAAPDPAALAAAVDGQGMNALHWALLPRAPGSCEVIRLLLDISPALASAPNCVGSTPLHFAAARGRFEAVSVLLQAAPSTAAAEDNVGRVALDVVCLFWNGHLSYNSLPRCDTARLLIAAPGLQPQRTLAALARARGVPAMLPLFADVATHYPLSPADWRLIPSPCVGLAAALPAVLQRSTSEASLLVVRLPEAEHCRLRTAALSLHRAQAALGICLPLPLVWRILAACLA